MWTTKWVDIWLGSQAVISSTESTDSRLPAASLREEIHINIFINDLDDGTDSTLSKFWISSPAVVCQLSNPVSGLASWMGLGLTPQVTGLLNEPLGHTKMLFSIPFSGTISRAGDPDWSGPKVHLLACLGMSKDPVSQLFPCVQDQWDSGHEWGHSLPCSHPSFWLTYLLGAASPLCALPQKKQTSRKQIQ